MNRKYLTVADVAAALEVSDESVRRWAATGTIAYFRLPGGQLRFRPEVIEQITGEPATVEDTEAAG